MISQVTTNQLQRCNNARKNNSCSPLKQKTIEARIYNVKILLSTRSAINAFPYLYVVIENKMSSAVFREQLKSIVIGKIFELGKSVTFTRQHEKCLQISFCGNSVNLICNLTNAKPVSGLFLHSSA